MKGVFLLLLLVGMIRADGSVAKVVYDLTTGDLKVFEKSILKGIAVHKEHYEGSLRELDVAVVVHGDAYKFFVKDPDNQLLKGDIELIEAHDELKARIRAMADTYGVSFLMCRVGMRRNKLQKSDIYSFVTLVPTSTIGLIDKQNSGYAYIPVNN